MVEYLETDWCAKWALYSPDKFFLREYSSGLEWTYSEFNSKANAFANYLINDLKLVKGERVAVYSKNRAEFILLYIACVKAGTILVPLNFRLTPRELDTLIHDAEPSLFIYESGFEEEVKRLTTLDPIPNKLEMEAVNNWLINDFSKTDLKFENVPDFEDPVMILYTAGTT